MSDNDTDRQKDEDSTGGGIKSQKNQNVMKKEKRMMHRN